jgi:hypothetical protein
MIVAIHQPNYLPYAGFFYKMLKADVFVILDNVQFSRGGYINRNRIKNPSGPVWLTQPVPHKKETYQIINQIEMPGPAWKREHLNTISKYYRRARAFDTFFPRLKDAYMSIESNNLADFNAALIAQLASWLGVTTRLVRASELPPYEGSATTLNANICRVLGADIYLCGTGARAAYMEDEVFKDMGIGLMYSDFQHPVYPQLWGEFTPNMSIVDMLLNCGEESAEIIRMNKPVLSKVEGTVLVG